MATTMVGNRVPVKVEGASGDDDQTLWQHLGAIKFLDIEKMAQEAVAPRAWHGLCYRPSGRPG